MSFKKTFLLLSFVLLLPNFAFAQPTEPPTRGTTSGLTYECAARTAPDGTTIYGECTFEDLVAAVMHVVDWGTGFALSFTVFVIAYAGWNYLRSADNPGKRRDANKTLTKAVVGIAIIVGAWLIVRLITSALGVDTGISNLG